MYTTAVAGLPFSIAFVVAVSFKTQVVVSSSQYDTLLITSPTAA
jgi:hypothetical protein